MSHTRWALVLLATSCALAGCGGGSSQRSPNFVTPPTPPPVTSTATSIPTGAAKTFTLSSHFSTTDGYSFVVTGTVTVSAATAANDSQLPPGQSVVALPVNGSVTITNTTSGRTANTDPLSNSYVDALYKAPTPVCPVPQQGPTDATYMRLNSTLYCIGPILMLQDNTSTNGLPSGRHVSLDVTPATCENEDNLPGGCGTVPTASNQVAFDYRSADEPKALQALAQPPALVVLVGATGGEQPTGVCTPSDNDGWLAASSTPITSCG